MKDQIKEIRLEIDGLAQLTKELKPFKENKTINAIDFIKLEYFNYNSKEIEKTIDSLYIAKAWQGKMLGELGTENLYGSGYKTKEDIVATQDVAIVLYLMVTEHKNIGNFNWEESNHIEKVDWLRTEIETIIEKVKNIPLTRTTLIAPDDNNNYTDTIMTNEGISKIWRASREFAIARTNCYTHLCEARFNLGFELQRIKETT